MISSVVLPDERSWCAEEGCGDKELIAFKGISTIVRDVDGVPVVEVNWNRAARSIVYEDAGGKAELSEE
jgi:hypothetical protein